MLRRLSLVVASIVAGLGIVEVALRVADVPTFRRAHTQPATPQFAFVGQQDGTLFYTNTPSADITFVYDGNPRGYFDATGAVHHHTNSLGFRGREFSTSKDANTYRIAFLGDSFTFGEGVKDEDVYAEQLVQQLGASVHGPKFEAYNFGVGGFNTEQELFVLKSVALRFKPDAVVLGYTLNDAEPELFTIDPVTHQAKRSVREASTHEGMADVEPPSLAFFRLRLARLVWLALGRRYATAKTVEYYTALYREDAPGWVTTKASLARYAQLCAEFKLDCYVVIFPLLFHLDAAYPFVRQTALVTRAVSAGRTKGPLVIDLFAALKGRRDADLWVHPTDQHPNELVHRIAADQLRAAMIARHPDWQ